MFKKICAPFVVIKHEKSYIIWVLTVFVFGLINVWGSILLSGFNSFLSVLSDGPGYTFAISICVPQVAEVIIRLIVDRRNNRKWHFVAYKLIPVLIIIPFVVLLAFLWTGILIENMIIQVIMVIISIFMSFYLYCVNQMEQHPEITQEFDDIPYDYLNNEKNDMNKLDKDSKNIKNAKTRNGVIKL